MSGWVIDTDCPDIKVHLDVNSGRNKARQSHTSHYSCILLCEEGIVKGIATILTYISTSLFDDTLKLKQELYILPVTL